MCNTISSIEKSKKDLSRMSSKKKCVLDERTGNIDTMKCLTHMVEWRWETPEESCPFSTLDISKEEAHHIVTGLKGNIFPRIMK